MQMELINILLGGGILAFIQWAVDKLSLWHTKNDKTVKAIDGLTDKVSALKETMDERDAVLARTHILRFNDEIYNGVKHSKEYFDQTLEDIDNYDKFCKEHPDFRNSRTVMAAQNIKDTYNRLLDSHNFL
jgi:hypothetical protein